MVAVCGMVGGGGRELWFVTAHEQPVLSVWSIKRLLSGPVRSTFGIETPTFVFIVRFWCSLTELVGLCYLSQRDKT